MSQVLRRREVDDSRIEQIRPKIIYYNKCTRVTTIISRNSATTQVLEYDVFISIMQMAQYNKKNERHRTASSDTTQHRIHATRDKTSRTTIARETTD